MSFDPIAPQLLFLPRFPVDIGRVGGPVGSQPKRLPTFSSDRVKFRGAYRKLALPADDQCFRVGCMTGAAWIEGRNVIAIVDVETNTT